MASSRQTTLFLPNRRLFVWYLASLGLTSKALEGERLSQSTYHFLTPECEVRMSVQFLANTSTESFRFRDSQTNRSFCLSADGEENHGCLERFVGAMAIARYAIRSRRPSSTPLSLRERVITIDNDSRMIARPPFERLLAVEREVVSDIQVFGYNPDDPQQASFFKKPLAAWRLLRQDLYLGGQSTAFLIVHWKHALDVINLVDVIPGDGTEWLR
jgi:hypothetical protein